MAALVLAGCETPVDEVPIGEETEQDRENTVVNADLDLTGKVKAPVKGDAPDTTAINTAQYRGTVAWEDANGTAVSETFVADTVYTAVITLTAKSGFTFTGFTGDFTYSGDTSVTPSYAAKVVTITFPATAAEGEATKVNALDLTGKVTAPVKGAEPVTTAIDTAQYTGIVEWKENDGTTGVDGNFAASTVYKAVITLTVKEGFTFTGFAGTFTYSGATVSRAGTVVTITFPATAKDFAAIRDYLAAAEGGETDNDPVLLPPVGLDIADDWEGLLEAIRVAGKYVDLDLSDCTMTNMTDTTGEFYPGTADTGESKIVSLVLPDDVMSIKEGSYFYSTFRNFTNLKSVSGFEIISVGAYAFYNCPKLTTVNLPEARSIGSSAFAGCASLTTVSLLEATDIGQDAFYDCQALTTVSLPEARSIGSSAFNDCQSLTTVSLPAARSIGNSAFYRCVALTTVSLPAARSIGSSAFAFCESLNTVSLPAARSIGNSAFSNCYALNTVSLPAATSIDEYAFFECNALNTVNLPAAMSIGNYAFCICNALNTVSLGRTAPTLGSHMFYGIDDDKTVTVKVPTGATGYGTSIPATYSGSNSTANWGNGFRGGGWTGSAFTPDGFIDSAITLVIQYGP
jgi:hypothetical protein